MRPADGDILLAREAPVGPAVFIREAGRIAPGQRTVLIRAIAQQINARYLYYLLIGDRLQGVMREMSLGSTVPHLNVSDVRALEIGDLPNPSTQRAIGEVLGALDDKIEANRKIEADVDAFLTVSFEANARGIETGPVRAVANTLLGGTPNRANEAYWGGDVPWLNSGACNERFITTPSEHITELGLEKSAAKLLPVGTTAVAITGATLGQMGWIGREMAANQSVVGVVGPEAHRPWIHYALRQERDQLLNWATGGAQQHVNTQAVASVQIRFDVAASERFNELARPLMDRVVTGREESQVLARTRDELLPLLLSGKITVKDAERSAEEVL